MWQWKMTFVASSHINSFYCLLFIYLFSSLLTLQAYWVSYSAVRENITLVQPGCCLQLLQTSWQVVKCSNLSMFLPLNRSEHLLQTAHSSHRHYLFTMWTVSSDAHAEIRERKSRCDRIMTCADRSWLLNECPISSLKMRDIVFCLTVPFFYIKIDVEKNIVTVFLHHQLSLWIQVWSNQSEILPMHFEA